MHPEAVEGASNYDKKVADYVAIDPDDDRNPAAVNWYVTGTDADDFAIANGALMFVDPPDYEDPSDRAHDGNNDGDFEDDVDDPAEDSTYKITLRATEAMAIGGGPKKSAELDVTVTVEDRNEPGKVTLQWLQPEVGTPIMAMVTDPDGAVTNPTWQWYQAEVASPNPNPDPDPTTLTNEWVAIDVAGSGDGTNEYTPQGDDADEDTDDGTTIDEGKHLLALATYTEDTETRYAAAVSMYAVRADVADEVNGSPNFVGDAVTFELDERTEGSKGDTVGRVYVLPANVGDNDILTYSLVAAAVPNAGDLDFFEINKETGEVKVKKSLSFEEDDDRDYTNNPVTAGEYKFIVRATDPSGEYRPDPTNKPNEYKNRDDIAVTVKALEENEFPKVTEGEAELTVNEADSTKKPDDPRYFVKLGHELNNATPPQQVRSTTRPNLYGVIDPDEDDTGHLVDVMGPDRGKLELVTWETDQPGYRLQFKDYTPNYEMPGDDNGDNVYEVEIVVTNTSNSVVEVRMPVTVEVMNIEEDGKVTLTPEQPSVASDADPASGTVTATLTDDDLTADMVDGASVHTITYWQWYWTETDTNPVFNISDDPDTTDIDERDELDDTGNLATTQGKIAGATTSTYTAKAGDGEGDTGDIGRYLHAKVEYRDGFSVTDDPATPLMDERNDDPDTENTTETDFDSDEMLLGRSDNAVQTDPTAPPGPGPGPGDGAGPAGPPTMRTERLEVAENTPGTGYVGAPVSLTSGLTYVLAGTDGEHFVLADDLSTGDANNRQSDAYAANNRQMKPGQIAVALSPRVTQLDAESDKNAYEVVLTGSDDDGQRDILTVEIAVMGVNEAPRMPEGLAGALEITGQDSVRRDEGDSLDVATYIVVGGDAEGAMWMPLGGTDADDFDFMEGVLTFKMAPDFEMPTDANGDNAYQVSLSASDSEGIQTFRKEVLVIIANVNEDGSVEVSTDMPQVGVELMAQNLMDPDIIDDATITWQWARSDMMDGPWTDIDGATGMAYTPMESPEPEAGATKEPDDVEMFLRVTAMYVDGHGAGKSASAMTDNAVGVIPDNDGEVNLSTTQPFVGREITAMLEDMDTPVAETIMWQWSRSPDGMDDTFTDIYGATDASYTPVKADLTMYLKATVMYDDGHSMDKEESAKTDAPVMMPPADTCIEPLGALMDPVTKMGTWADNCASEAKSGSYARYYTFTLDAQTQVEMNLNSSANTYLALREGEGRTGRLVTRNDDVSSRYTHSSINWDLAAGTYTVEATTVYPRTNDFTLSVRPLTCTENLGALTRSVDRSNSLLGRRLRIHRTGGKLRAVLHLHPERGNACWDQPDLCPEHVPVLDGNHNRRGVGGYGKRRRAEPTDPQLWY